MSARGIIRKVSFRRKDKEPRFEIHFPEKRFQKIFVGFGLDYFMAYLEEIPLRYHKMKAEYIVKCAREAELAMLSESRASKKAKSNDEVESLIEHEITVVIL